RHRELLLRDGRDLAHDRIGAATGAPRHNHTDVPARVVLRLRRAGDGGGAEPADQHRLEPLQSSSPSPLLGSPQTSAPGAGEERRRLEDLVLLAQQVARLGTLLEVRGPGRVRLERRALAGTVGRILVSPDVYVGVDVAGLRDGVEHRLAEVLALDRVAVLLVERQVLLDGPGSARVGAVVVDHDAMPPAW